MKRNLLRTSSAFAMLAALASLAAFAACSDVGEAGPADGGLPEGAILGPDGEILFPDGASEAGSDADAAVVVDNEPLSAAYVDRDINMILSTGQSNSVASGARPFTTLPLDTVAITSTQPYTNLMFDTGVMTSQSCGGAGCTPAAYVNPTSFVPLIEGDSFFGGTYVVETASSAMANMISRLALEKHEFNSPARPTYPKKHDVLVSLHGRSGNKYICLRKTAQTDPFRAPAGDCSLTYRPAFDEGMMQARRGHELALAEGKTHVVRAVTVIHGESDHNGLLGDFPMTGSDGTPDKIKSYADALIEWQQDYEAGVKEITGQAEGVPLFVMGLSGWTGPGPYAGEPESPRYSAVAAQQHEAHVRAPGKVVLVAPGYVIDQGTKGSNNTTPECLHQSIVGQRQIGEYFAKAYAKMIFKGQAWEPVRPKTVSRAGNVVTVEYHVPVPPLVLDTVLVQSRPEESFGFEYRVEGRKGPRIGITNVAVAGTTVTITLATTPVGADQRLLYALNQPPAGQGCTGSGIQSDGTVYAGGARGNLRDSDATPSSYGYPLYNWGVMYDVPVP